MAAFCCRPTCPLRNSPLNAWYPLMDPFSNGPEGKCKEREARFLSNCSRLGENADIFVRCRSIGSKNISRGLKQSSSAANSLHKASSSLDCLWCQSWGVLQSGERRAKPPDGHSCARGERAATGPAELPAPLASLPSAHSPGHSYVSKIAEKKIVCDIYTYIYTYTYIHIYIYVCF